MIQVQVSERQSSLHVESGVLGRSLQVFLGASQSWFHVVSAQMWEDWAKLCCDCNKLSCFYLFCSNFLSFDFL